MEAIDTTMMTDMVALMIINHNVAEVSREAIEKMMLCIVATMPNEVGVVEPAAIDSTLVLA